MINKMKLINLLALLGFAISLFYAIQMSIVFVIYVFIPNYIHYKATGELIWQLKNILKLIDGMEIKQTDGYNVLKKLRKMIIG